MTKKDIIYNYCLQKSSIVILTLDKTEKIVRANDYALKIIGNEILSKKFSDIVVDFIGSFRIADVIKQKKNPVILDIQTIFNIPYNFNFSFFECEDEIIVIGEHDNFTKETLKTNFIIINNELSNLTRELHKKNAEMEHLIYLKNQLLGMAAHDLRNPISQIKLCSEILIEDTDNIFNDEQREFLQIIERSSDFMLGILNNFLDFAAVDSGLITLVRVQVNINAVIERNVGLNSLIAAKKNIKIEFNGDENIPDLNIDIQKIEQVLNNLISNAVKFSPSHSIIKVLAKKEKNMLNISVKDEGQGIPETESVKLFKPFSTTSVRSSNGEASTGLGLAIAKKIVEMHGGEIGFESTIGKGSLFYFLLPL